jgi:hypothetical protein
LDHILLSFHFIHCFPEFNFLKFDGFSTFISSNVFTNFNYLKFYLSCAFIPSIIYPEIQLSKFLSFQTFISFLSHIEIFISYICSAFSSSIVFFGFNCPKLSISPLPIYHPMFYFPLFHFISSIVFPRFNISQFSIFPNPHIIHYLSNSQLLTPNISTKRPIIVLKMEDSTTIYNSNTLSQTFGEWQSRKLILRKYE